MCHPINGCKVPFLGPVGANYLQKKKLIYMSATTTFF